MGGGGRGGCTVGDCSPWPILYDFIKLTKVNTERLSNDA